MITSVLARTALLPVLLATLVAPTARAEAHRYTIDPVHSRVLFSVGHAGFSNALGTFSGPTGELLFDADDWASAQVDVEIPIGRLELGDADWNARMFRRDFFDLDDHPTARFRSTAVEVQGDGQARVAGLLTLRGVDHPVVLDVRLNRLARHPLTLRRTAGFSATAALSRSALGLRAWKSLIGDSVSLSIEVEATRARRRGAGDGATDGTPSAGSDQ